jgi:ligand-binding SRPBCC domain-containing protein
MVFTLQKTQIIPLSLRESWEFFSNPYNLPKITPDSLSFSIVGIQPPEKIYAGLAIRYKVSPILGIPLTWVSTITNVVEEKLFVDQQLVGPYRLWHHQHHFKEHTLGTEMVDIIHYKPWAIPGLASAVNSMIVLPQLSKIFEHRRKSIEKLFGTTAA